MNAAVRSSSLRLATSREALSPQLSALLALQRAEEPETPITLVETPSAAIFQGLMRGCFDLGIAWATSTEPPLSILPLWRDELAVAMPIRSPLLAYSTISPTQLLHQRLFYWCPQDCEALNLRTDNLQRDNLPPTSSAATSFDLMAVLVSADYGIGIAPRARIVQARGLGIVMRPLAEGPYWIATKLFHSLGDTSPACDRFAMRARRVAESEHSPASPHSPHGRRSEPRRTNSLPLLPR